MRNEWQIRAGAVLFFLAPYYFLPPSKSQVDTRALVVNTWTFPALCRINSNIFRVFLFEFSQFFFYYRVLFFFCWGVWRREAAKQRRGPPLSCRLPSVYLQCSNNQLANAIMISEGMNCSEWDIIPLISAIQLRHGTGLIYRLYIPPLIRTGLFWLALFICLNGT